MIGLSQRVLNIIVFISLTSIVHNLIEVKKGVKPEPSNPSLRNPFQNHTSVTRLEPTSEHNLESGDNSSLVLDSDSKSEPREDPTPAPEAAAASDPEPAPSESEEKHTAVPEPSLQPESNTEPEDSNNTLAPESAPEPKPKSDKRFLHYDDYRTRFPIPDWMEEYLQTQPANKPQAHIDMLENPNNKFLVLTCYKYGNGALEDCGGFSDRMGILPYYVHLAKNTSRKLLIKYHKPCRLEEYLVPPEDGFDWRLPDGYLMEEWYEYGNRTAAEYKADRRIKWHQRLQEEEWKNKRVVFVNNNLVMMSIKKDQDKMIGAVGDDLWPGLFRRFFQPSEGLAQAMAPILEQNPGLEPGKYAAAHLRVRWPGGIGRYVKYIGQKWWNADKRGGLADMTDLNTTKTIAKLGDHAVECAVRLVPDVPYVYVASDVGEVIDYLINNSTYWGDVTTNSPPRSWNGSALEFFNSTRAIEHGWGVGPWEVPTTAKIISRTDYNVEAPHYDSKVFTNPEDGYSAFVDIWMMAHAGCHTTGVGGYGRFTSVLSGMRKSCATRHRDYSGFAPSCPTPDERKAWKRLHPHIDFSKLDGTHNARRRRLMRLLQIDE